MPVTINGSGPIAGVTSINTTVSDTELGYLDGVTSALQTQINTKAADSSQGLYLITPSSIANTTGSASASGGAVTFSGVTSLSLNGIFTSTYDNYLLIIRCLGSADDFVTWRLRTSGTDATGANYDWNYLPIDSAVNTPVRSTGQTSMRYGRIGTSVGTTQLFLSGPALSAPTHSSNTVIYGLGIAQIYMTGYHSLSTSYDGWTLTPVAGNLTGTVRVYGYKNS